MLFCEPQVGWRHIAVTAQRTMQDFAEQMRWRIDQRYPEAEVIRVVLNNLNSHKPASLYAAFAPRRSAAHFEEAQISLHARGRLARSGRHANMRQPSLAPTRAQTRGVRPPTELESALLRAISSQPADVQQRILGQAAQGR